MTTHTFHAAAVNIGAAIEPLNPHAGLTKAVTIVGADRVREITARLKAYDGSLIDVCLADLSAGWSTASSPIAPAINHLRELGQTAILTAIAANLLVKSATGRYNVDALNALSPGVRAMAGLPSHAEIEAALPVAGG